MPSIFEGLNTNQKIAVEYLNGALRLIAGAGSGKTKVLTHKIAYLVQEVGILPSKILAVTFTNKAAKEMKERVANIIGIEKASKAILSTYHYMCIKILRQEINFLNYDKFFSIIDNIDQKQILRSIYDKYNVSSKTMPYNYMISYISYAKSNLIDADKLLKEAITDGEKYQALIFKDYQKLLFKNKSLDFDDLLIFVYKIFSESKAILTKWQNKFDYILVDEFQDTSWVQYEIIKKLNKTDNLTIVGDPDQTIYTWRGAKVELIINFDKDFKNTFTINLEENYRSTTEILKAANNLIGYNKNRLEKKLYTNNEQGKKIEFYHADYPESESKWIVKKIKELKKDKINLDEITIFYRSNYLSKRVEQALTFNNINYRIFGDVKFFNRSEIKDAIAFLKVINNGDEVGLQRIINVPARKLGFTTVAKLNDAAMEAGMNLFDYINNNFNNLPVSAAQRNTIVLLFNLFHKHSKAIEKNPISLVLENFLIELGYYDSLKFFKEQSRLLNIKELIQSIKRWEKNNANKTLGDYLEETLLASSQNEVKDSNSAVTLMTIHTSKGLEFDNVFIIGLSEGVFPTQKAIISGENAIEEERRLAYVAITRTKKRLYLSDSQGYSTDHNAMKRPSRFLREMGLKIKEHGQQIIPNSFKENYTKEDRNFSVGDKIKHKVFGYGVITKQQGEKITIIFKEPHHQKTLMKNHKSIIGG